MYDSVPCVDPMNSLRNKGTGNVCLSIKHHLPGRSSLLLGCLSFLILKGIVLPKGVPNCFICKEKFRELVPPSKKEPAYMKRMKFINSLKSSLASGSKIYELGDLGSLKLSGSQVFYFVKCYHSIKCARKDQKTSGGLSVLRSTTQY